MELFNEPKLTNSSKCNSLSVFIMNLRAEFCVRNIVDMIFTN